MNFRTGLLILSGLMCVHASQSGDTEKNYPVVAAPLYEFGRRGFGTGAFRQPSALAVGADDLLYVADSGNHRVLKFSMNGMDRGAFGQCGTGAGEFVFPSAIAVTPEGEVLVADAGTGRLQRFSAEGKALGSWEGLSGPRGIAVAKDRIYVTEEEGHRIRILFRNGDPARMIGGVGQQPGRFLSPAGIAVDDLGMIYVADSGNHRIQKLDPEGRPLAQWGAWGAQAGLLSYPSGLALANGLLYVADYANHRVQVFDRSGVLQRQWGSAPAQPGQGAGRFHFPEAIAVSPSGGLVVVAEPMECRLQVFMNRDQVKSVRVNDLPWWDGLHARTHAMRLAPPPPGCSPQMAGSFAANDVHAVFFFDIATNAMGPLVTAGGYGRKLGELNGIGGVAVDHERGRAFVSDRGNRRIVQYALVRDAQRPELFNGRIRVVSAHSIDRLVPNPPPEYSPDRAVPGPLALDAKGMLHLFDRGNSMIVVCEPDFRFVRLIPVPPSSREFALGPDGTLLVTDPSACQVRAFGADGKPVRSWGRRDEKADDGFLLPSGIAVDDQGFVYVADGLLDCVKKFDSRGRFVKRWGEWGRQQDRLATPRALTFSRPHKLLVEDLGNHRAQLCSTEGEWLGMYVAGGLATPIAIR